MPIVDALGVLLCLYGVVLCGVGLTALWKAKRIRKLVAKQFTEETMKRQTEKQGTRFSSRDRK
jgi:hypothetical protein